MTNNDPITPLADDAQVHLFWQGFDLFHPGHGLPNLTAAEARVEARRILAEEKPKLIRVTPWDNKKIAYTWVPRRGWFIAEMAGH